MKKHLETILKSFSFPRDQLSPIPPDEYASRFVKFIRANIKTREQVAREKKAEEVPEVVPLNTIEEQEDRQILEDAQKQANKEGSSHGKKEEVDVGRKPTLSPDHEKPEQVLPTVTVRQNQNSHERTDDGEKTGSMENGTVFPNEEMVKSPKEEVSLGSLEKTIKMPPDGNAISRPVEA